jgi:CRISPR-associated exonuclease Cas4
MINYAHNYGGHTRESLGHPMTSYGDYIPVADIRVTDVKQFIYCPRILFYTYSMPLKRITTHKMGFGKEEHQRVSELEERRKLKIYGLDEGEREFHCHLFSPRLGLRGLLDMVIRTKDEIIPVEFKNSEKGPSLNHKYQLTAYALLLEDTYKCIIRRGFIHLIPLKKSLEIEVSPNMRKFTKEILYKIREMVIWQTLPKPTPYRERCVDCEFRKFCGDIDVKSRIS